MSQPLKVTPVLINPVSESTKLKAIEQNAANPQKGLLPMMPVVDKQLASLARALHHRILCM